MTPDANDQASREVSRLYWAGQHKEALALCLSLVDSGRAAAWILSLIGRMYFLGIGTARDRQAGLSWYRRAVAAGDPGALVFLSGFERQSGRYSEAKAMLDKAASQNYPLAFIQLGYLYDHGFGVERDTRRARQYYEEAASQGYVFAKRLIAGQLLRGQDGLIGIPRGLLMLLSAVREYLKIRIRDPHSEKIRR